MRVQPKCFISYSWDDDEHKQWVKKLATKMRENGIDTILDQWHLAPGDHLTYFMEKSITESDYTIIICTPKYKLKSDSRISGVGFEENIISAKAFANNDHRKIIPVMRYGEWNDCAPNWLKGKYYIKLSDDFLEDTYDELIQTIWNDREPPPKLGTYKKRHQQNDVPNIAPSDREIEEDKKLQLTTRSLSVSKTARDAQKLRELYEEGTPEWKEELLFRLGEKIYEGLTEPELDEFDAIIAGNQIVIEKIIRSRHPNGDYKADPMCSILTTEFGLKIGSVEFENELAQLIWLSEHRPDYQNVVQETIGELHTGYGQGTNEKEGDERTKSPGAPTRIDNRIGRNDPCPCGKKRPNGLPMKYKDCCGSPVYPR